MTASALVEMITETDPVRSWRVQQLQRAGYDPIDSLVLSGRPEIDLHLAERLLRDGCPPEVALRILV